MKINMNTNSPIKAIKRKISSLGEVKIVVLGAPNVGKSAITVRFLTKRFIGEYNQEIENKYRYEAMVDGDPVIFEVVDTKSTPQGSFSLPRDEITQWADGFMLVYSVTDRRSFDLMTELKQHICTTKSLVHIPAILVANKADMVHARQVALDEGEKLAEDLQCLFVEVAASENVLQVANCFFDLYREVQAHRGRSRSSLLDRVFGINKEKK